MMAAQSVNCTFYEHGLILVPCTILVEQDEFVHIEYIDPAYHEPVLCVVSKTKIRTDPDYYFPVKTKLEKIKTAFALIVDVLDSLLFT
jgi:hypothetical protein